ncbi:MAG: hypothetical protein ACK4FE_02590 [Azonexus sp.]
MNESNPENPVEDASETPPAVAPQFDARRRLRELLSVPERDRSDEQWDEIIELEIQLAPGNRISGSEPHGGGNPGRGHQQPHGKAGGQQQKKHRPRANNNRRPRQNKPQSGGGGNPA